MNKIIKTIKNIFIPESEILKDKIECAIDEQIIECEKMNDCMPSWGHSDLEYLTNNPSSYTGVPAPVYLKEDDWFGPAPEYTEKQKDYMKMETEIKRQEFEKSFSVEPNDIHQKMYEIATKNHNTTLDLNPPGGSENFHEGPGGWNSGNGWGLYK